MKVIFRFKPDDEQAWVGFTEGSTWGEIFWNIDEFGDPFEANVIKLPHKYHMGFCIPFTNDESEGWDSVAEDREVTDMFYEAVPDIDSPEWETKESKEWRKYIVNAASNIFLEEGANGVYSEFYD